MESATEKYDEERDVDRVTEDLGYREAASDMHFKAGQSKRVWGELYKVFAKLTVIVSRFINRKEKETCVVVFLLLHGDTEICTIFWKVTLPYLM